MKIVSLNSLASKMKYYFDLVSNSMDTIIIPRSDKEDDAIVIMSIQEYNSLKETEYILSTSANRKRLEASIAEIQKLNQ